MRPITKKSNSWSRWCALLAIVVCSFALWNCSSHSSSSPEEISYDSNASVALKLEYPSVPLIDSLVLDCFGTDTIHMVNAADDPVFKADLFPNKLWNFVAKIYANGILMQVGELEAELKAGSTANLSIQMHAVVGFVYVEIPLGFNNKGEIKSGEMKLTSKDSIYKIPLVLQDSYGYFKSGNLKLGETYSLDVTLFDREDKEIYSLKDKFQLTEDSPVPNFTLNALRAQVTFIIEAAENRELEFSIYLPAKSKKPEVNDLIITEVFPAPDTKDSTQFEFVELYNGSVDTLIVNECSLVIASSKPIPLTAGKLAPNSTLVLGSVKSEATPDAYKNTESWTDMTNTKGSVALLCNETVLDSLYYGPVDSLHLNNVPAVTSSKNGISAQLDINRWNDRKDSSAWTLAVPTPGSVK
ncbi:MAG: lamin tail domain-containing protein [Fibrobacter sp.]|nr:lamin tail domain-containing protein [Fibrobacter sp.]